MSEKLNVGIWGLGRAGNGMHIGEFHALSDIYSIVAGYDIDPERRAEARKKCPEMTVYDNEADFLKHPGLDLVTVATRSPMHVEHAIRALEAGKYAVCEKPVAVNYWEACKLKAAGAKFPGKLFIRHNRRFEPAFAHVREIIASGKIGNVYEIKLCRHSYQWRDDWQTITSLGGGQLLNWGPHLIDHALQFIQGPVESVWSDLKLTAALGDAEDHLKILIRGTSGILVDIEISGGIAIASPVYAVYGSRGTLICQDEKTIKLRYFNEEERPHHASHPENPPLYGGFSGTQPKWIEEEIPVNPASGVSTGGTFRYIYEDIKGIRPYAVTIDEALEIVRVTDMIKAQSKVQDIR